VTLGVLNSISDRTEVFFMCVVPLNAFTAAYEELKAVTDPGSISSLALLFGFYLSCNIVNMGYVDREAVCSAESVSCLREYTW
jgi:hypothetical protein